jgi:hypothetical protein
MARYRKKVKPTLHEHKYELLNKHERKDLKIRGRVAYSRLHDVYKFTCPTCGTDRVVDLCKTRSGFCECVCGEKCLVAENVKLSRKPNVDEEENT